MAEQHLADMRGRPQRRLIPPEDQPEADYDVGYDDVALWRQEKLLEAGYSDLHAALLAANRQVDLHKAVELAEKAGEDLAFRIMH